MVSVALYILDSGEKQMLEDRAICDEYAEKNGYEIKKVFSEPLIQGMDNYGKRLGFLTFIGELQELGVEYVIVPSPKHLKGFDIARSEEHTSELQSRFDLVCRLLLEKKKNNRIRDVVIILE